MNHSTLGTDPAINTYPMPKVMDLFWELKKDYGFFAALSPQELEQFGMQHVNRRERNSSEDGYNFVPLGGSSSIEIAFGKDDFFDDIDNSPYDSTLSLSDGTRRIGVIRHEFANNIMRGVFSLGFGLHQKLFLSKGNDSIYLGTHTIHGVKRKPAILVTSDGEGNNVSGEKNIINRMELSKEEIDRVYVDFCTLFTSWRNEVSQQRAHIENALQANRYYNRSGAIKDILSQ